MLPHFYFIAGSALLGIGIFVVFLIAVIGANIFSFHFRVMRPMGFSRSFLAPVIALMLGLAGVFSGALLLKKCDFSCRKSFIGILIAFLAVVIISGVIIDVSGFNEHPRPPRMMNMMYRELPEGDWISGRISDVSTSSADVEIKGGKIKTITWDEDTKFPPHPFSGLKQGDFIRTVGEKIEDGFHTEFIGVGWKIGGPRMRRK